MVYLIVDKKCENDIQKIDEYKENLKKIYNDRVESIIQDNRRVTPLGEMGEALEEKGRKITEMLKNSRAVYLFRKEEILRIK